MDKHLDLKKLDQHNLRSSINSFYDFIGFYERGLKLAPKTRAELITKIRKDALYLESFLIAINAIEHTGKEENN